MNIYQQLECITKIIKDKEQLKLVIKMLLEDISMISEFTDNDVPTAYKKSTESKCKN